MTIHDVIVVGGGPAGSSVATFLAQHGMSVLLLERAEFPRDKVCGDGLTPQALVWLDILGCTEEVLSQASSCLTTTDLFIDGEHALTARFPQHTGYPAFGTCLERRKLDLILVTNAVSNGAQLRTGHLVRNLSWLDDSVVVEGETKRGSFRFRGRLVIGADGANSIVSRMIGNNLRRSTVALYLRGYYEGVSKAGSPIGIFVSERSLPGYGWLFADENGNANVGVGYLSDRKFPVRHNLPGLFRDFLRTELSPMLGDARPVGRPAGWWEDLARPTSLVADRVMLIGDSGNQADPMNGAGIHKAMESAYLAAEVAAGAALEGDWSKRTLLRYERAWQERCELDWRIGDLFVSIVKNPDLRDLYLSLLRTLGSVTLRDRRFQDFCSGVFSGTIPQSTLLSPLALIDAVPLDLGVWSSLLSTTGEGRSDGLTGLAAPAIRSVGRLGASIVTSPIESGAWGLEVVGKALGIAGCYAKRSLEASS